MAHPSRAPERLAPANNDRNAATVRPPPHKNKGEHDQPTEDELFAILVAHLG